MKPLARAKTVCMVVFSYYPRDPRVRREAEALAAAGMDVDVICLAARGEPDAEEVGPVSVHRIMRGTDRKETILRYLAHTSLFFVLATVRLARLSAGKRYDLVQIHNMPDHLVFTGIFHKLLRRPILLDLHDLTPEMFASKWGGGSKLGLFPLIRLVERISCAVADHVITTSEGFRTQLVRRGVSPEKVTLVLNTADERIFRRNGTVTYRTIDRDAVLLYHGTVDRRFGVHLAVEALGMIRNAIPGAKLLVYGKYDPSYRDELEATIRRLGLGSAVSLKGLRPHEELVDIIGGADFGIVPYLSDPFMDLALSTKTFECVCMGLPVVAARLPSLTNLFGAESIGYFDPGNPGGLADKVVALCRDPEARRRQADNAKRQYRDLAWPVMSARYVDLVSRMTEAR